MADAYVCHRLGLNPVSAQIDPGHGVVATPAPQGYR